MKLKKVIKYVANKNVQSCINNFVDMSVCTCTEAEAQTDITSSEVEIKLLSELNFLKQENKLLKEKFGKSAEEIKI